MDPYLFDDDATPGPLVSSGGSNRRSNLHSNNGDLAVDNGVHDGVEPTTTVRPQTVLRSNSRPRVTATYIAILSFPFMCSLGGTAAACLYVISSSLSDFYNQHASAILGIVFTCSTLLLLTSSFVLIAALMDKWEDYYTEKKSDGMKDSTTDEELQGQGHSESFDQGNDELTVKDDDGVIMGWHMKALQNAFIGFTAVLVCAVKIEWHLRLDKWNFWKLY